MRIEELEYDGYFIAAPYGEYVYQRVGHTSGARFVDTFGDLTYTYQSVTNAALEPADREGQSRRPRNLRPYTPTEVRDAHSV